MDKKTLSPILKKCMLHLVAVLVMYLLTVVYFSPVIFEKKDLPQGDMLSVNYMTKEVSDYQKESGEYSGWLNSMFCGMPTETLYGKPAFNVFGEINKCIRVGLPYHSAAILFTYMLCFYIFMLCMGSNVGLALLMAIAYGFASYNIIIIEAGHITKSYAIALMAPVMGGAILLYRKKYIAGFLTALIAIGMLVACSHLQIDYYVMIIVGCLVVAYLINSIISAKKGNKSELVSFGKSTSLLVVAAVLGALPSMANLYSAYEYSKDTMRGGSELTISSTDSEDNPNAEGLNIDYAYAWSYDKTETFTLLVPNLYGGGHVVLEKGDPTIKELKKAGYGSPYLPTYWGEQPFTSGPVYVGAIICFLCVLGIFMLKGPELYAFLAAIAISFILSWGRHFLPLNEWFFHYLPFYNKFRTPSMALTIAGVVMVVMAGLGLRKFFGGKIAKELLWKKLLHSFYITAGLCLFVIIVGKLFFTYEGAGDAGFGKQLADAGFQQENISRVMDILREYRESMLLKDAFRSLLFVCSAFAVLALYVKGKMKKAVYVVSILSVLVLIDMWSIDKRYLNDKDFVSMKNSSKSYEPTAADTEILRDEDINYRVLNLASNTFNEAKTSYFHKSVGGYSPAKLRRYQDMIDFHISKDMKTAFVNIVQARGDMAQVDPSSLGVLNALNVKYFILPGNDGSQIPLKNPHVYGDAWFVNGLKIVENPDEEILALKETSLRDVAVVDKRYKSLLDGFEFKNDSAASITNVECKPNRLKYRVSSSCDQVAVFSEIFYDKGGWTAYLDGEEVPHFRADYVLRAMKVPAGDHEIEFKYVPYARLTGIKIANVVSCLNIVVVLALLYLLYTRRKKENEACNDITCM